MSATRKWVLWTHLSIYVDPYTGAILRTDNALASPIGYRAGSALYPLHVGLLGGVPTRALHGLVGLTPAVLCWTGTLMWWRRTFARRSHLGLPARDRPYRSRWPAIEFD